jgi:amino acid transporter
LVNQVSPGWNVPINAVIVSLVITAVLSMINIGSTVALNAINSLTLSALLSSYIITITCILIKRLRGHPLPPSRWTLGRWGLAVNFAALCFLAPIFVFVFFPLATPVNPTSMNWGIVMYTGVISLATIYYIVWGRKQYTPPAALVKRDRDIQ